LARCRAFLLTEKISLQESSDLLQISRLAPSRQIPSASLQQHVADKQSLIAAGTIVKQISSALLQLAKPLCLFAQMV